jgi:hypothetical protein
LAAAIGDDLIPWCTTLNQACIVIAEPLHAIAEVCLAALAHMLRDVDVALARRRGVLARDDVASVLRARVDKVFLAEAQLRDDSGAGGAAQSGRGAGAGVRDKPLADAAEVENAFLWRLVEHCHKPLARSLCAFGRHPAGACI